MGTDNDALAVAGRLIQAAEAGSFADRSCALDRDFEAIWPPQPIPRQLS